MRLSQDQTRVTLLTSCFCHPGELYFLATSYPSAMSAFGTVFKFMDPSRYSVRPGVYYIYTWEWEWEHLLGEIIQKDRRVFQTGFNSSHGKEKKSRGPNNYELYIKEE